MISTPYVYSVDVAYSQTFQCVTPQSILGMEETQNCHFCFRERYCDLLHSNPWAWGHFMSLIKDFPLLSLSEDGLGNSDLRAEGVFWPELWLYVQDPHHRQQQCRQNLLLVSLRRRLLHTGLCQHSWHRLQGEDHLQERQEDQITDLGKMTRSGKEDISWAENYAEFAYWYLVEFNLFDSLTG